MKSKKLQNLINETINVELKKTGFRNFRIKEDAPVAIQEPAPVPTAPSDENVKATFRVNKFFELLKAKPQIMKYLSNLNDIQKRTAAAKFLNLIDLPMEKFTQMKHLTRKSRQQ